MNWEAFFELLKRHPGKTLMGAAFLLTVGSSFGGWLLHSEQCHERGDAGFEMASQLAETLEHQAIQKEAVNKRIDELCKEGALPDKPVTCAKAEASLE